MTRAKSGRISFLDVLSAVPHFFEGLLAVYLLSEIALQVADLLEGGCTLLALAGGGAGGAFFHDKAKNNRDKMRYSNLSNNMMISKLQTTITIQIRAFRITLSRCLF